MHKKIILPILLTVVCLSIFVASAAGLIVLDHAVYLSYTNGSSVVLPAGTYFTIERVDDVWYVNGVVYPAVPTPTPVPTATPTPTVTPIPTAIPFPTSIPSATAIPSPTPVPTYDPTNRPSDTLNLYMRSDIYTVFNVTAYGLDTDYTNEYAEVTTTTTGVANVTYGFMAYLVASPTSIIDLTGGIPVAHIPLTGNYSGQLSSSWTCPTTAVTLGYQAIKIDVYVSTDDGASWSARAGFISNRLITHWLVSSTWTLTLNLNHTITSDTVSSFSFGDTDHRSTITGIAVEQAIEPEKQWFRLNMGDLIGFIIGGYADVMGAQIFYVLILFGVNAALYRRYNHFGIVAVFFILFAGPGGLILLFVPSWAVAVVALLMIVGCALIVWRLIR